MPAAFFDFVRGPRVLGRVALRSRIFKPDHAAQGDVEVAIAVHVHCHAGDRVVAAVGDDGLLPVGVAIPDQWPFRAADDDVEFAVGVRGRPTILIQGFCGGFSSMITCWNRREAGSPARTGPAEQHNSSKTKFFIAKFLSGMIEPAFRLPGSARGPHVAFARRTACLRCRAVRRR